MTKGYPDSIFDKPVEAMRLGQNRRASVAGWMPCWECSIAPNAHTRTHALMPNVTNAKIGALLEVKYRTKRAHDVEVCWGFFFKFPFFLPFLS